MVLYHDAVAILAAAVKRRNNKKWLRAEFELKSECISHDYPYPYPKLIDSPQMDHVRRARARRRMMKQKFNKIFGIPSKEPPISPPSSSPALASTSTATADSQQPITPCPVAAAPPTTAPSSPIPPKTLPTAKTATTPANPPINEQPNKTAKELKADINKDLDKRPPVFVVSGEYIRQKIKAGACCIYLQNKNDTRIEGDIENRPLLIVRHFKDMAATGLQCHYRFIHMNEHQNDNYVLYAFIGSMEKSNDFFDLPNDIAHIYSLHKSTIIGTNTSHHGSYGLYYADGLKASYQKLDESLSSIGGYATHNLNTPSFERFQVAQNAINSCIHQANKFLVSELDNNDAIKLAANSSCVKLLKEIYNLTPLPQTRTLDTLHSGEHDLYWCSSNVCVNAGTEQYHTEIDTSMTMILRPYFQSCVCRKSCSQYRTTFNFKIHVNGSEELKIPLVDGCVILFSGYLLEHRQQNAVRESRKAIKLNCKTDFVNVSCYSNGRFSNNLKTTTKRVFQIVEN
ncbi:hypothetical protein ACHAXM_008901 [Skeletonema potamos]